MAAPLKDSFRSLKKSASTLLYRLISSTHLSCDDFFTFSQDVITRKNGGSTKGLAFKELIHLPLITCYQHFYNLKLLFDIKKLFKSNTSI